MLKVNESGWDRIIRVVLGVVLLYLGVGGITSGVLSIGLDIVGAILILTGLVGVCPLYMLFKISTKKASMKTS